MKPLDARTTGWFNLAGLVTVLAAINVGTFEFFVQSFFPGTAPSVLVKILAVAGITASHALLNHLGIRVTTRLTDFSGYWILAIAALFRFPKASDDVPVEVTFDVSGGRETWRRDFAGRAFQSIQSQGKGAFERLIAERFGPFVFGLALVIEDGRLNLVLRGWRCLGIPLPLSWAPGGAAHETAHDGKFRFHVEIGHPLCGRIVRYEGWLDPPQPI